MLKQGSRLLNMDSDPDHFDTNPPENIININCQCGKLIKNALNKRILDLGRQNGQKLLFSNMRDQNAWF